MQDAGCTVSPEQRHFPVIIIGGGQAGLSTSWYCRKARIDHVILERNEPCHVWRDERWDSFCLVTPNWQCQLPGYPYAGGDPRGFMVKDEIIAYLDGFIASFNPPLHTGVEVQSLAPRANGGFLLTTGAGTYTADQVVVATGGYHDPILPAYTARLDPETVQVHSTEYRNPLALPDGGVLVVGTGQSGAQIAEDLHLAGRQVHLCVGSSPRVARFYRGKDVVEWLDMMGYYDLSVDAHPLRAGVRDRTNHYVTGRDGGRDIDLRRFASEGMCLYGSLAEITDGCAHFSPDLATNLDEADETSAGIKRSIDAFIDKQHVAVPEERPYEPLWQPGSPITSLALRDAAIRSVVWCIGFRSNFRWIAAPVFDERGLPQHHRGVTNQDGLYFVGLPWLHTWGSGRFSGISRDADYIVQQVVARAQPKAAVRVA